MQSKNINKVRALLYTVGNTSSRIISDLVLYPHSGFGGKIFLLGSIRFNQESIDSKFLHLPLLLVCGNYPLTSKRGRCRNLLSIDSRLNRIDPSTNIFPPNPERGYKTKFEILLE